MRKEEIRNYILTEHPCYSKAAHFKNYRLHLPVSIKCNLGCNYCQRSIGKKYQYRPGVAEKILTPQKAVEHVETCLSKNSALSIIGIAGPGEPLANPETFITIKLIRQKYPELNFCLSTNGILIEDHIIDIINLGVGSISITINSFNKKTIGKLYSHVITNQLALVTGETAIDYILHKQQSALEILAATKIVYKVNTILLPGINDWEIEEIAKKISFYGAQLHNIVPFIPVGKLATDVHQVTAAEMEQARSNSAKYMNQFTHCKQCPADAYDIPGIVI